MKISKHTLTSVVIIGIASMVLIPKMVAAQQADTTTIRFYDDPRDVVINNYYHKLLQMALSETEDQYGPFKIEPVMKQYIQREAFRRLRTGDGVDVVCSIISTAREWVLRAIKIPLTRGYIGYRLIMVNQSDKNLFENVTDIKALNKYKLGQEYDWPDTQILKSNGVKVVTSQTYDSLFTMLADHEIDGFPRGVYEIWKELKMHSKMHFTIANGIYLKYPQDFFFYVKKDNLTLARRIKDGLLKGINDGSFDRLFNKNLEPSIKAAQLDKRHPVLLTNPEYAKLMEDSPLK